MTVTLDNIVLKVRELAAAQPDFRCKDFVRKQQVARGCPAEPDHMIACVYLDDDQEPSCIVACAVMAVAEEKGEADFWRAELNASEGDSAYSVLESLEDEEGLKKEWIDTVQSHQDGNLEWEACVEIADEEVPLV